MTVKERILFRTSVSLGNVMGGLYGLWLGQQEGTAPMAQAVVGFVFLIAANAISQGLTKSALGIPDLET